MQGSEALLASCSSFPLPFWVARQPHSYFHVAPQPFHGCPRVGKLFHELSGRTFSCVSPPSQSFVAYLTGFLTGHLFNRPRVLSDWQGRLLAYLTGISHDLLHHLQYSLNYHHLAYLTGSAQYFSSNCQYATYCTHHDLCLHPRVFHDTNTSIFHDAQPRQPPSPSRSNPVPGHQ